MKTLIILAAITGALLCAQMPAADNGTGTIVVYRPWSMTSAIYGFPFNVDDGPTIKVRNGCYYRLAVRPGPHVIDHRKGFLETSDPQRCQVQAGQTVYFLYTAHTMMGRIFEVAEDQAEAAQRVSQLKAQN